MDTYVLLIRGINVGGKNKVSMPDLKLHLEETGYDSVETYINSGNIVVKSNKKPSAIKSEIESQLPNWFKLDSELIRVLILSASELIEIVKLRPHGFGDEPEKYHSDVIFLMDIDTNEAFSIFEPREGVDSVWKGNSVIYSQRLSSQRTKSRLNKIMSSPLYKSMTIRNWNTTMKLYNIVRDI